MFQERWTSFAVIVAVALGASACDETSSPTDDGRTVAEFVASASVDDAEGALQLSGIPRPAAGGPAISVAGNGTIVNGGTATMTVTSPTPFETVFVSGSSPISKLFVDVTGYFEIPLPAPTTSAELLIAFPQALPSADFELYFAVADAAGKIGTLAEKSFAALFVGTGDVQVTVTWDSNADVDLHVVDPAGWEIYWGDRSSPSGGELDLDSNAACDIDDVRNENITWGVGEAPQGLYTVRLDYWSNCDAPSTKYTVLINNGGDVEIFHGTFTGEGDFGGFGSGILIDTFTRTTGPLPAPAAQTIPTQPAGPTLKGERSL